MNTAVLDPLIYEFDTVAEAESYDAWFREKVEKSIADPTPSMPHDEAMAFVNAELEHRRAARAAR